MAAQRQLSEDDGRDPRTSSATILNTLSRSAFSNSRASFMIQSLSLGACSGAIVGVGSAILLRGPFGGALAFTVGSCAGFTLGSIWHHITSLRTALDAVLEFPALMRAHIRWNYPETNCETLLGTDAGWRAWRRSAFGPQPTKAFSSWTYALMTGDPRKTAMAMSSYYSAAEAIAVIKKQQEEAIIAQYTDSSVEKKEIEEEEDAEFTRS
ncbi:hypothetical protein HDU88_002925 [Geranomyces variabilis]|nr:hypothetical protein HDU88_002925 [Geranomyces variabilis]